MINKSLLFAGASAAGVSVSEEQAELIDKFSEMVAEANSRFNLTSILSPDDFTEKHVLDSLSALPLIPENATLCDIGAGAGFPSVPIAIMRPDVTVTALDSTAKKTAFIASVATSLSLQNLNTLTGRAEERTHERESFSVVTARAVAPLPVLAELALPLVKPGGVFIAYKTPGEKDLSQKTLSLLGAAPPSRVPYTLPSGDKRELLVFKKTTNTDADFPRPFGKIKKSPLV